MCDPVSIGLGATALAGGLSAYGQVQQGKAAVQVGKNNQIMADRAAQDAQKRGELEVQAINRRAAQIGGAQRANMAAKGLSLESGTPAELLAQTDFFAAVDAEQARFNAKSEASNLTWQGKNARAQGDMSKYNSNLGAAGTVLSAASSVAGKWYEPAPKPKV